MYLYNLQHTTGCPHYRRIANKMNGTNCANCNLALCEYIRIQKERNVKKPKLRFEACHMSELQSTKRYLVPMCPKCNKIYGRALYIMWKIGLPECDCGHHYNVKYAKSRNQCTHPRCCQYYYQWINLGICGCVVLMAIIFISYYMLI